MNKELKRVRIARGTELTSLAEAVNLDKEPRLLERDGEVLAALVSLEDLDRLMLAGPAAEGISRALSVAGAWSDMSDEVIESIYRARHESPPSLPIEF